MRIEFAPIQTKTGPDAALAVVAFEGAALSPQAQALDQAMGGAIGRAVAAGRFTGAKGQTLELLAPMGVEAGRVVLVGAGPAPLNAQGAETAAAQAFQAVKASGAKTLVVRLGDDAELAAHAAFGVRLAAYRFDRYRTTEKADKKPSIESVVIQTADQAGAQAAFAPLSALADGVSFTRDLVSEPANILYPAEFARRVKALESLGLEVEILGEAEMAKLGMGSLLGVGQGSVRESQLAVIQWKGGGDAQPIAFVGKGVCFDTGGISIKPAEGMEDMKWDMGGAGAVAGLMHVLAGRKA